MVLNYRNVIEKLYIELRDTPEAANLLQELDKLHAGNQGITLEKTAVLCEDVEKFFPEKYRRVSEAKVLVDHAKQEREKKAKEMKDAGTPNP